MEDRERYILYPVGIVLCMLWLIPEYQPSTHPFPFVLSRGYEWSKAEAEKPKPKPKAPTDPTPTEYLLKKPPPPQKKTNSDKNAWSKEKKNPSGYYLDIAMAYRYRSKSKLMKVRWGLGPDYTYYSTLQCRHIQRYIWLRRLVNT